jgi:non-heme chloroperoxidase
MALSYEDLTAPLPATETFITTADGTRLRTLTAGVGPTVVLAHGYAFTSLEWHVIARTLLAAGRRVILFDQRGHGASSIGNDGVTSAAMASDYLAVLEHYDVTDAVIIGHSMGGFLLLRFLLRSPEVAAKRVRHAVILASFAGLVNQGSPQNRLQLPLIRSGLMVAAIGFAPIARAFTKTLMGQGYSEACMRAFIPVFRETNHRALWPILKAFGDENYYPQLKDITVPCTVMVGDRDKTTPAFHTKDMARLLPRAELISLPGVGHLANWEAVDPVAAVLLKHSAVT